MPLFRWRWLSSSDGFAAGCSRPGSSGGTAPASRGPVAHGLSGILTKEPPLPSGFHKLLLRKYIHSFLRCIGDAKVCGRVGGRNTTTRPMLSLFFSFSSPPGKWCCSLENACETIPRAVLLRGGTRMSNANKTRSNAPPRGATREGARAREYCMV